MKTIQYYILIVASLLMAALLSIYLLNFKYNSSSYSLMVLSKCSKDKDTLTLNKFCNLNLFTDSAISHINEVLSLSDSLRQSALIELIKIKENSGNVAFYFAVYEMIEREYGEVISIKEININDIQEATLEYRPLFSQRACFLNMIFKTEKKVFQLQYITNFDVFLSDYLLKKSINYVQ